MGWRNWPSDKQGRWVFSMTMIVMVAGLFIGLLLSAIVR